MQSPIQSLGLKARLQLLVLCCTLIACTPMLYIWDASAWQKITMVGALVIFSLVVSDYALHKFNDGLSALETGLLNFVDGEFSSQLAYNDDDQLGELCRLYNQTSEKLRAEKHWLYQRELMLDKVLQNSPEVLLLVNDREQVVFSNWAARHFFAMSSTKLEGMSLADLLKHAPEGVADVVSQGKEGLFSLTGEEHEQQTWHLGAGEFLLNNQRHMLYILKQMTRELSRLEVAVWKKVIRIISHELNNSLGPISSMLHSGKLLTEQVEDKRLNRVFDTIEERIQHLITFVQGYGKFAKLPEPKIHDVDLDELLDKLAQQWTFKYPRDTKLTIKADDIQLEQLLINLLKNAHESGSTETDVELQIQHTGTRLHIDVLDRGKGMTETVLSQALIPFYSTKASGSGLGLALCREIAEAHHGHIALQNRDAGGLSVRVSLPVH